MTEHMPGRPGWDCLTCGEPWPCAPAKVHLSEEYRGAHSSLMVYLHLQLKEVVDAAAKAHDWGKVDDLYDRFVGWTRPVGGDPHAA